MKRFFFPALLLLFYGSCKNKTADLSGNEKINAEDFFKAFHEIKLPLTVVDSSLKNFGDSTVISKTIFTEFITDTAIAAVERNPDKNFTIHPAGIIHKKEQDFLLTKFTSGKKVQLSVFVFNDKHIYLTNFPLLNNAGSDGYTYSASITEEPTFILKKEKLNVNNTSSYNRNGYAYSAAANAFLPVLHDSNEDTARINEIINPIDTLPSTNRYSGDYVGDKRNFISVRDGKSALTYTFFIHFEKNNAACIGELKGMMTLTTEKTAVFNDSGDPCVINFKFTGNTIKITEEGNCGNHRGITCPFDLSFKKKTLPAKKLHK